MSLWCLKKVLFFTVFLVTLVLTFPAFASETYFSSYLKLKGGYDSNIAFTYYNPEEDFIAVVSPFFYLNYKTSRTACYSKVGLDFYEYAKHTKLNTVNQYYEVKGDYLLKENLKVYGKASFIKDTTLQSELQETGIVHVREGRKRYNLTLGSEYFIDELNQLSLEISGARTEYAWKYYVDYNTINVSTKLQHQMKTQRDFLIFNLYYTNTNSEASKVNQSGFIIGWKHLLSETTNFVISSGACYSIMNYYVYYQSIIFNSSVWPPFQVIIVKKRQTDKEWNYLFNFFIQKQEEKLNYFLGGNHNLIYSSFGETVKRTLFFGKISYKWTPRLSSLFSLNYYITYSEGRIYKEDNRYVTFRSRVRYALRKNCFFEFLYSYSYFDNRVRNHIFDRNQVWLILTFQFGKPPATEYKTF